jgi:acylphosphatase
MASNKDKITNSDFVDAYRRVRKPTAPAERVLPDKRSKIDDEQEYKEYEKFREYEEHPVRARVIVTGKVQGVFFRALAQEQAAAAGVTGWVRNRSDGSVELILEGLKEAVQQVIDWSYVGPPAARVDNVEIFWEPATGEFSSFEARHTF